MDKAELREKVQRAIDGAYLDLGSRLAAEVVVAIVGKACAEIAGDWPNDGNEGVSDTYYCQLGDAAAVKAEIAAAILAMTQETPADAG